MASRKRKAPPAPVAQRIATRQGILLELDALPGDSGVNLSHADFVKDGTGVGQVWQAATDILCDFLESFPSVVDVPSVLELGAGVGVPGLLAARLGARRVVLTDYQPHVLARLRQNVAANQLERACAVEHLSWGELPDSAERYQLLMGADLAATSRSASLLAATVARLLEAGGVWIYAHNERKAVYRAADGSVQTEATDSALEALITALAPKADAASATMSCRQLHARPVEAASREGEHVLLLAFGRPDALARLPAWPAHQERCASPHSSDDESNARESVY